MHDSLHSSYTQDGFHFLRRPAEGGRRLHFAHATGFNAITYRDLFKAVDSRIDLIALDSRGHGKSTAAAEPRSLRSWRGYERDLAAFLRGRNAPTTLAGHSMGGTVSAQVAAEHPDMVDSLVLIEPVLLDPRQRWKVVLAQALGLAKRLPIAQAAARRIMEFDSRDAAIENFVGKGPFRTWGRASIEAYIDGGTVPSASGGVRLSCDRQWESRTFSVATNNPFDYIRKIQCPITLIVGGKGSTCPQSSRDAFMKLQPGTRLIELADASHFVPMEHPDLVITELERSALPTSDG